jgi:hypothetical protein
MKPVSKPEKPASLPVENRQILDVFEFWNLADKLAIFSVLTPAGFSSRTVL